MSSEWRTFSLGELGRIITGKTPSTARPGFFGGHIPFLTPTDMVDGQKTVQAMRTLTDAGLSTVKNCLVPRGVAVSCIGWQMGKSVLVLEPTVTNQQINTLVVDESRFNLSFIYYLLANMRDRIFELGATPTRTPIVNKSIFSRIAVQIPGLDDQKEIAALGAMLDDRITLLRETNANLEAIAQALFKSWFVDFDPVCAKQQGLAPEGMDEATSALFPDGFEESELGLVPRGWQAQRLESFIELAYGKALKATDRTPGDVPVYGSGGITGYHNESFTNGPSVIVGRKGTVGTLYWEDQPFFPIDTVFYLRSRIPMTYCFYLLQTLGLSEMNTDAAVPGLNRNNVYRLTVAMPSVDLLKAFDDVVKAIRDSIFRNQQQAQILATLRDTLLPRVISGQLRLPETMEQTHA